MKRRRAVLGRGAGCVLALVSACTTPGGPAVDAPDARDGLPAADVQLPPVPNLELIDVPETFDDGSYSVSGLARHRAELRGQPVRVTGILHTLYTCEVGNQGVDGAAGELAPDAGPSEASDGVRPGCLRPHLYLADSLRARRRILVTDYDASLYEPQLVPGQRYTVFGRYDQQTRGFVSTEDGLVVATQIVGDGITIPDPELPPPR